MYNRDTVVIWGQGSFHEEEHLNCNLVDRRQLLRQTWGKVIPERSHELGGNTTYLCEDLKGQHACSTELSGKYKLSLESEAGDKHMQLCELCSPGFVFCPMNKGMSLTGWGQCYDLIIAWLKSLKPQSRDQFVRDQEWTRMAFCCNNPGKRWQKPFDQQRKEVCRYKRFESR